VSKRNKKKPVPAKARVPAAPKPQVAAPPSVEVLQAIVELPQLAVPVRPAPARSRLTACYVDFENFLYTSQKLGHTLDVAKLARQLSRLSREASGDSWAHTAVYACWDAVSTVARHAQDEWAMVGWKTVTVPGREDYQSRRMVKNLADFMMSLDILEDARDRPWDHFFIASGDADFCEVAERLKRLRKRITVVAMQANLSYRLQEAADDYVICSPEDLAGPAGAPRGYRTLAEVRVGPERERSEDPYQVLCRMVRLAEKDQGRQPVPWKVVREEYLARTLDMPLEELDRFVRELAEAGFVNLVSRKDKLGRSQSFISIPR